MRPIKFRALHKSHEPKWLFSNGYYYDGVNHWFILPTADQANHFPVALAAYRIVIAETIGQFTGLKDRTGKEIYEGDVIITQEYSDRPYSKNKRTKRHIGEVIYVIESGNFPGLQLTPGYYAAGWEVQIKDMGNFHCSCWGPFLDCEVIGNIYETPELLEATP